METFIVSSYDVMTAMFVAQNNPQGIMRQAHFYFALNKKKTMKITWKKEQLISFTLH